MKRLPLIVEADRLKQFFRYEITYDELTAGRKDVVFDEYEFTLDDIAVACANMKRSKTSRQTFIMDWFDHVFYELYDELGLKRLDKMRFMLKHYFSLDVEMINCFIEWCQNEREIYFKRHTGDVIPDYGQIVKSVKVFKENQMLPVEERKFTLPMKYTLVKGRGNPSSVNHADDLTCMIYKKAVNDLCRAKIAFGYRVRGYSYLMGTKCFKKNMAKALDNFLTLYEMNEDVYIAEIIGDLYYGGTEIDPPDYEMAYKYYSIACMYGIKSAVLKVSDMLCRGKGTIKNEHVGKRLVFEMFDDAYKEFCRHEAGSFLSDVTVRMGMIFDTGIDTAVDKLEAYKFYNIARYALNMKKELNEQSDADEMLIEDVNDRCRELGSEIGCNPNASSIFSDVPNMLLACMVDGYEVRTEITKVKKEYKLRTVRICKADEPRPQSMLIEYPLNDYCALLDEVEEYMPVKGTKIWLEDDENNFFDSDEMLLTDKHECVFKYKGEIVAKIKTSMFTCRLKRD